MRKTDVVYRCHGIIVERLDDKHLLAIIRNTNNVAIRLTPHLYDVTLALDAIDVDANNWRGIIAGYRSLTTLEAIRDGRFELTTIPDEEGSCIILKYAA